jgi:hypothetical protein
VCVGFEVAQGPNPETKSDPFDQKVALVELREETIFDAIGRLNQSYDVAISIEGILPNQGTIANPKFQAKIENRTVSEVLTWLCALDGRYMWVRDGTMANLFPKTLHNDSHYFFNRRLSVLKFEQVQQLDDAVLAVVHQLDDPNEHIVFLGIGGTQSFAQPWTAKFHDITVREALNRIAEHLGPTYGWQIGGTTKARIIMFHYKLGAHHFSPPPPDNGPTS